ncbi:glycosyl transferases group 1 family protein [Clostridium baratii str. Sullivan]|uniref:Glycosyl transferases group 1 family protein n=1 Tax=Clostridium baratii str. Sullivan TaxID=1415775 RepID=A0A0A7FU88_9CLOT|nr:glycosyltransferase family 4 protein [Clostridium baratii]AIY83148.1 glycosyl transferases group 1 family protein [Clostridium baratii str. Sullivan]
MKIMHICSYYPSSKLYENLLDKLNNENVDNTVYIPCKPSSVEKIKRSSKNSKFIISPIFLEGKNLLEKFKNCSERALFYKHNEILYYDLIDKINVINYECVHAHSLFSNGYLAYKLRKNYGLEYIVAVRNTDINYFFKYMKHLKKVGIEIMKNAKKIIFISKSYKEYVLNNILNEKNRELLNEKMIVIPNGIDDYWLYNSYNSKSKNIGKKINMIQVGRLNKNKNILTSIKVCDNLKAKGMNINLKIIGEGPIKTKLEKKIINKNYIKIIGNLSKEKLKDEYDGSHIFIMPSKKETFGLVYPEAMSRGLPVIYTRNQGFDKFFEEGYIGFSAKYNDELEIEKNILMIIDNYSEMSKNAIEKSRDFDWSKIAKIYKEIYIN